MTANEIKNLDIYGPGKFDVFLKSGKIISLRQDYPTNHHIWFHDETGALCARTHFDREKRFRQENIAIKAEDIERIEILQSPAEAEKQKEKDISSGQMALFVWIFISVIVVLWKSCN